MFNSLEKLRNQSKAQRTLIAFSISLLFTGVVFVMWLATNRNTENVPESASVAQNSASNTPTDNLLKNAQDVWSSLVGANAEISSTLKNTGFSSTSEYNMASSTPTNP